MFLLKISVISTDKLRSLYYRGVILSYDKQICSIERKNSDKQNIHHSNAISKQEKLGHQKSQIHYFITDFVQQGEMLCHRWHIIKWPIKWWWSHSETWSQRSRLFEDQRVYHEEYSGHRHHEPAEFVWEGLERLGLARDWVDSLHPGVLGFKLRPQLLLNQSTHSSMLNLNCEVIKWCLSYLRMMLTYFFLLPINEVPVISQFCPPPFPELQEYCGCREGSGISHIIDQLWYVTHSVIDNLQRAINTTSWSDILSQTQAAVTCMAHYGNWLQPSVPRLLRLCGEVKENRQQQIGFPCTMFHPQIISLSGQIHFMLKDFKK